MFFTRRGAHSESQSKRKSITRVREMGKFSSLTPDEIENKLDSYSPHLPSPSPKTQTRVTFLGTADIPITGAAEGRMVPCLEN